MKMKRLFCEWEKKRGKLSNGSYKLGPVETDETVEVHLEKIQSLVPLNLKVSKL